MNCVICRDSSAIKEWRRDKQSFSKSMEKVSRRNEGIQQYFIYTIERESRIYNLHSLLIGTRIQNIRAIIL